MSDEPKTYFDRLLERIGPLDSHLECHLAVTLGLIHDWKDAKACAAEGGESQAWHKGREAGLAMSILSKFYREPFCETDPTWGAYREFMAIFPHGELNYGGNRREVMNQFFAEVAASVPKAWKEHLKKESK